MVGTATVFLLFSLSFLPPPSRRTFSVIYLLLIDLDHSFVDRAGCYWSACVIPHILLFEVIIIFLFKKNN